MEVQARFEDIGLVFNVLKDFLVGSQLKRPTFYCLLPGLRMKVMEPELDCITLRSPQYSSDAPFHTSLSLRSFIFHRKELRNGDAIFLNQLRMDLTLSRHLLYIQW